MIKIYTYKKCSTCRRATRWLDERGLAYEEHAIRDTPPSRKELKSMLAVYAGNLRRLFNTSGMDYRNLGLKDKLPAMNETEAFSLLSQNGNLVKRPFLMSDSFKVVGFKESDWLEGLTRTGAADG